MHRRAARRHGALADSEALALRALLAAAVLLGALPAAPALALDDAEAFRRYEKLCAERHTPYVAAALGCDQLREEREAVRQEIESVVAGVCRNANNGCVARSDAAYARIAGELGCRELAPSCAPPGEAPPPARAGLRFDCSQDERNCVHACQGRVFIRRFHIEGANRAFVQSVRWDTGEVYNHAFVPPLRRGEFRVSTDFRSVEEAKAYLGEWLETLCPAFEEAGLVEESLLGSLGSALGSAFTSWLRGPRDARPSRGRARCCGVRG